MEDVRRTLEAPIYPSPPYPHPLICSWEEQFLQSVPPLIAASSRHITFSLVSGVVGAHLWLDERLSSATQRQHQVQGGATFEIVIRCCLVVDPAMTVVSMACLDMRSPILG